MLEHLKQEKDRLERKGYRIKSDSLGYEVRYLGEFVQGAASERKFFPAGNYRRRSWQGVRQDTQDMLRSAIIAAKHHESQLLPACA